MAKSNERTALAEVSEGVGWQRRVDDRVDVYVRGPVRVRVIWQGDDAIRWSRAKNYVGCHLEDSIEIESGSERFAHLVNFAEDVRLALQRFQNLVAALWHHGATTDAGIRLAQHRLQNVFRRHQ